MSTSVIVHVGYPKTATTWLQSELFPSVQNALFVGKATGGMFFGRRHSRQLPTADAYANLVSIAANKTDESTFILSEEKLVAFGIENVVNAFLSIGHNIGIVLGIRKQQDLILSRHNHNVRPKFYKKWHPISKKDGPLRLLGETCRFESVNAAVKDGVIDDEHFAFYDYNSIYNRIGDMCPIHMLPYEGVFSNTDETVLNLEAFMHSVSGSDVVFDKKTIVRTQKKVNKHPHTVSMSTDVCNAIANRFAETNAMLDEQIEANLKALGYYE